MFVSNRLRFIWVAAVLLCISLSARATDPRFVVHTFTSGQDTHITIEDDQTDLEWEQGSASPGGYTWVNALAYCDNLDFGGHQDWRLPNVMEISSLVDELKTDAPAINTTFFNGLFNSIQFWTSTTDPKNPSTAYAIKFSGTADEYAGGGVLAQGKGLSSLALCVRTRP